MNTDTPGPPVTPPAPEDPARTAHPAPATSGDRLLEARLVRLEQYLGFRPLEAAEMEAILGAPEQPAPPAARPGTQPEGGLEMEIGEFWLARIGMVALIIGLGFLVAYPFQGLPSWMPSLMGFVAAGGLVAVARRWDPSLPEMARLMFWGALFTGYFATVRLHYFSSHPLVASRELTLGLLVLVMLAEFVVALRRRSEGTAVLVTFLTFVTAIISHTMPLALTLAVVLAVLAAWWVRQYNWWWHYGVVLVLTFLLHLQYLLGNPLAGHPFHGVAAAPSNLVFLALYAVAFSTVEFLPGAECKEVPLRVGQPLVLSGGVILVGGLNELLFFRDRLPWVGLAMAAGFLLLAIGGWRHHRSRYATSIHACAGYLTLSIFLMRFFPVPDSYGWLAWEGLLVAGTAVWFRSKIIVVANVFIFAGIYATYLLFADPSGPVNLSFAVVALLTARLLNWQHRRLDLRTALMRNFYLGAATVAVPYGLYHTVPPAWVSTSWLLAAGGYFGVSLLLHNRKYRWMAIGTVFATIIYVFVVDLSRLAPAYRIVSFLVLGVALVAISLGYARSRRRRDRSN